MTIQGSLCLLSRCLEPEVDPEPEAELEPEVGQRATYRARGDLLSQVPPSSPPIMVYNSHAIVCMFLCVGGRTQCSYVAKQHTTKSTQNPV